MNKFIAILFVSLATSLSYAKKKPKSSMIELRFNTFEYVQQGKKEYYKPALMRCFLKNKGKLITPVMHSILGKFHINVPKNAIGKNQKVICLPKIGDEARCSQVILSLKKIVKKPNSCFYHLCFSKKDGNYTTKQPRCVKNNS